MLAIDKESPNDISLTLHLDTNAEAFNKTDTVKGQKALNLINDIQKEGKDDKI